MVVSHTGERRTTGVRVCVRALHASMFLTPESSAHQARLGGRRSSQCSCCRFLHCGALPLPPMGRLSDQIMKLHQSLFETGAPACDLTITGCVSLAFSVGAASSFCLASRSFPMRERRCHSAKGVTSFSFFAASHE